MDEHSSTSENQSRLISGTPSGLLRAHPALPPSQQRRINAWIDTKPGSFTSDDMPQLVELARHMDRAERVVNEMHERDSNALVRGSLEDHVAAEDARIKALASRLGLDKAP
jgi:hypothetical protein